jgi:hypothetical protein
VSRPKIRGQRRKRSQSKRSSPPQTEEITVESWLSGTPICPYCSLPNDNGPCCECIEKRQYELECDAYLAEMHDEP